MTNGQQRRVNLPSPRGPLSAQVFAVLQGPPDGLRTLPEINHVAGALDEDEQLCLYLLQELSFRPVDGVDPGWEDAPSFLVLRAALETAMERALRLEVGHRRCPPDDIASALLDLIDVAEGPSLSTWMLEQGTIDHVRELVVHRAAYQLKEADPHSFAIPRLAPGRAKAALLTIQLDEYGGSVPSESHASLFAATMETLGLDGTGPDLDRTPVTTLATNTFLNRLGRSRRLLGACLGHLAVFEMTSVEAMARYAATLRRVLPGADGTRAARFFDVHVAADGYHERIAIDEMVGGLVEQHPELASEVLFGAAGLMQVEQAFTDYLLSCWDQGCSSLRRPLPGSELRPLPAGCYARAS